MLIVFVETHYNSLLGWREYHRSLFRLFRHHAVRKSLTANPKKCSLARSEASYLGYTSGRGMVKPQQATVEAVRNTPTPRTKTQMRAFLGLVGYYRRFVPNFSSIAAPLSDLTKKGRPELVVWTTAEEEAFLKRKEALTTEPVLLRMPFSPSD